MIEWDLEFERGRLVKVNGQRPEYMDGYALIGLVRVLASVHCSSKGFNGTVTLTEKETTE